MLVDKARSRGGEGACPGACASPVMPTGRPLLRLRAATSVERGWVALLFCLPALPCPAPAAPGQPHAGLPLHRALARTSISSRCVTPDRHPARVKEAPARPSTTYVALPPRSAG